MRSDPAVIRRRTPASSLALAAVAALVAAAVLAAAGCGSSSTNLIGPTAQKCQISVTSFTGSFGASGGTGSAAIDAARECSWSAASQAAWIVVASADGTGSGSITFTVAANEAARARSGALVVNGQQLTVSQAAAPCTFRVAANPSQFEAAGGSGSVAVSTLDGCAWQASSGAPWLHLNGGGGSGSGSIGFSVDPNAGPDRAGTLTVAGQSVAVVQVAPPVTPGPPAPGGPGCQVSVAPSSLSFDAAGGQSSLRVTVSTGCAWQATPSASWIAVSPPSGTKSDTLTVSVAANTGPARSGSIVVGGQAVQVLQAAAALSTPVQVVGSVSHLRGGCPNLRLVVQAQDIVTDANTAYVNTTCDALKNGVPVIVDGLQQPGQAVLATRITSGG